MYKHFYLFLILITSCSSDDNGSVKENNGASSEIANNSRAELTYQISNEDVFSTASETVDGVVFTTFTVEKGFLLSTLSSGLGAFGKEKIFVIQWRITRQEGDPNFEVGTYPVNIAGKREEDFTTPTTSFAVVDAISLEDYEKFKDLGVSLFQDKFVLLPNPENKLVIEKAKTTREVSTLVDNVRTGSQYIEGFGEIHLMEANTGLSFSIKIDFKVTHEIRLTL